MAYGNLADQKTYWAARGYASGETITDDTHNTLRAIATTYIDAICWRKLDSGAMVSMFSGKPSAAGQENQQPRDDQADIYGNSLTDGIVPAAIERATYEAAYQEHVEPGSLMATYRPDQVIKREKTDVLETEFFEGGGSGSGNPSQIMIPAVQQHLAQLLIGGGSNPYGITMAVG